LQDLGIEQKIPNARTRRGKAVLAADFHFARSSSLAAAEQRLPDPRNAMRIRPGV
jgi:hypothetical protein